MHYTVLFVYILRTHLQTIGMRVVFQYEPAIMDAVHRHRTELASLCLKYNYDFDRPVNVGQLGTSSVIRLCFEKKEIELLRLLADVGYVILQVTSSHICQSPNVTKLYWNDWKKFVALGH